MNDGRSKVLLGRLIRILHFIGAAAVILGTLMASQATAKYYLVFWLVVIGFHLLCRGCILSRLERWLTQEDVTIVDPLLLLAGLDTSKYNRNAASLVIQFGMVGIAAKGHFAPL